MNKFWKIILTSLAVLAGVGIIGGIASAFSTNLFGNASVVLTGLIVVGVVIAFYGLFQGVKAIWTSALVLLFACGMSSCQYAKSNQRVLISDNCGSSWKEIPAGQSVPTGTANPCFIKVILPNAPMQGEAKYLANLKDKVRAIAEMDYDYSITNSVAFISQAKYLGKANKNADEALDDQTFEAAENSIIDKRLKDVAKSMFAAEDIVDMDQQALESRLLDEANKTLEPFGVHLNFITLTFDLDQQTRQAIDIATAQKIYESRGISDLGKTIMVARAGATQITVENKTETPAVNNGKED